MADLMTTAQLIKQTRAVCPEAFAITAAEAIRLNRIQNIIDDFFALHPEFIKPVETEGKEPLFARLFTEESTSLIMHELKTRRISVDSFIKSAEKAIAIPDWFLFAVSSIQPFELSLVSSNFDDGKKGRVISRSEFPAFYAAFEKNKDDIIALRNALGLDESFKYFSSYERSNLTSLLRVFTTYPNAGIVEQQNGFLTIISNRATTSLITIGKRAIDEATYDELNRRHLIRSSSANFKVRNIEILKHNPSHDKTLRQLVNKAVETNFQSPVVTITLNEFMEQRGLSDRKSARNTLRDSLAALCSITMILDENDEKYYITTPLKHVTYNYGVVEASFDEIYWDFLTSKRNRNYELFPLSALRITDNPKNPSNAYPFIAFMHDHKRRNLGKPNENKVSVRKLLEISTCPAAENIPKKHMQGQIVDPCFRALDFLKNNGFLEYTLIHRGAGNKPLTKTEAFEARHNYDFLITCVVLFNLSDQADYSFIRYRKEQRAEETKKRKAKQQAKQQQGKA